MKAGKLITAPLRFITGPFAPWPMAFAVAMGMVAGLTPLLGVHNLLILFLVLFFRINVAVFALSFVVFSALTFLLDPLFHQWGYHLLTSPDLKSLWTHWYNINFMRLSRFNNTMMMGSMVFALAAFIPVLLISWFILKKFSGALKNWAKKQPWAGGQNTAGESG